MRLNPFLLLMLSFVCSVSLASAEEKIGPPSLKLVTAFALKPFYKKCLPAKGLPVLSSEKVSDFALREAAYLINQMLKGREDVRQAMIANRVRFVIMAPTEMTTVVPEHSDLTPAQYWDRRARGLGATPERPAVSCGEENLLDYPGDPYTGENILIHEFAHAIHEMGLRTLDKTFDTKLETAYKNALAKGLWKGTYAATNPAEYWAEGVQDWFDCNQQPNPSHNSINTRKELLTYDPDLAALIASVFPDKNWRYTVPTKRKEPAHLKGYDPATAPRFAWDPTLVEWYKNYEAQRKP